MSDVYVWTARGYRVVEQDHDEGGAQRRHCWRCGAFLARRPSGETPRVDVVLDEGCYTDSDGVTCTFSYPREMTAEERAAGRSPAWVEGGEPYWACARCGETHDADRMFD